MENNPKQEIFIWYDKFDGLDVLTRLSALRTTFRELGVASYLFPKKDEQEARVLTNRVFQHMLRLSLIEWGFIDNNGSRPGFRVVRGLKEQLEVKADVATYRKDWENNCKALESRLPTYTFESEENGVGVL